MLLDIVQSAIACSAIKCYVPTSIRSDPIGSGNLATEIAKVP